MDRGKIYFSPLSQDCDGYESGEFCNLYDLDLTGGQGSLFENIFSALNENNIKITPKAIGSSLAVFDDTLWFCDNRMTAAAKFCIKKIFIKIKILTNLTFEIYS